MWILISFYTRAVIMPNGTANTVTFAPFLNRPIHKIPSTFLSFNFDWNLNRTSNDAWTNASIGFSLDLKNPYLIKLAAALAPANLRVGGSNADVAIYRSFAKDDGRKCSESVHAMHVCLTPERWDELIEFCQITRLRLVFDLNIMLGRSAINNNTWDSTNARALLAYTAKKFPTWAVRSNLAFELGNEKEFVLSALQTAQAFVELRKIIDDVFSALPRDNRPLLVGPSMNIRTDWLSNFLDLLGPRVIDVTSYHMYPGYGRSPDLSSLITRPAWLDFSRSVAAQVQHAVLVSQRGLDVLRGDLQIWIDETAAAWASGTAGVCNGYLSSFWYLDLLASTATSGHSAICRQCLVGGNYSLIEQRDIDNIKAWTPNPDYWLAWCWRQLVAGRGHDGANTMTTWLTVNQVMPYEGDFVPEVRMYLACTPQHSPHYQNGSVTAIWLNLDVKNKSILMYDQERNVNDLRESAPTPPFANLPRFEYVLTSKGGDLLSRKVKLNHVTLAVNFEEGAEFLPALPAANKGMTENFVVPAHSYGFAIYPEAKALACMTDSMS